MQIQISNEAQVLRLAKAAGCDNVEDFVNQLLKKEADLQALREGIEDADSGRVRSLDEYDVEYRQQRGLAPDTV